MTSCEQLFYNAATASYWDPNRGALGGWVTEESIKVIRQKKHVPEFSPGIRLQWYLEYSTNEYLDLYGDLNNVQAQAVLFELMDCR